MVYPFDRLAHQILTSPTGTSDRQTHHFSATELGTSEEGHEISHLAGWNSLLWTISPSTSICISEKDLAKLIHTKRGLEKNVLLRAISLLEPIGTGFYWFAALESTG